MKVQLSKSVDLNKIPSELVKAIDTAREEIRASAQQIQNTRDVLADGEMTFGLANLQYTINKVEEGLRLLHEARNMLASYVDITNGNYTEPQKHNTEQSDG